MINNLFSELERQLNLLKDLEHYKFEIGLLEENFNKLITIQVLNTDDTVSEMKETLHDVMYLIENGSMLIPSKPVISKLSIWFQDKLNITINKIIDYVLSNDNIDNSYINSELIIFTNAINSEIKIQFDILIKEMSYLSQTVENDNEAQLKINFDEIKKNISVKMTRI